MTESALSAEGPRGKYHAPRTPVQWLGRCAFEADSPMLDSTYSSRSMTNRAINALPTHGDRKRADRYPRDYYADSHSLYQRRYYELDFIKSSALNQVFIVAISVLPVNIVYSRGSGADNPCCTPSQAPEVTMSVQRVRSHPTRKTAVQCSARHAKRLRANTDTSQVPEVTTAIQHGTRHAIHPTRSARRMHKAPA